MQTNSLRVLVLVVVALGVLGGEPGTSAQTFPVVSSPVRCDPLPAPVPVVKVPYWRPVWVKVTAYSPFDDIDAAYRLTKGADRWKTSQGVDVRRQPYGIAADPRIMPYGTQVFVPGYMDSSHPDTGWAVDDTGGALRQAWTKDRVIALDVRYWTSYSVNKWGVSWQWVYVLINPDSPLEHQLERYDARVGGQSSPVL